LPASGRDVLPDVAVDIFLLRNSSEHRRGDAIGHLAREHAARRAVQVPVHALERVGAILRDEAATLPQPRGFGFDGMQSALFLR
jgi:hypothetical protein